MSDAFYKFLGGILVVAIIAVLISRNSKTAQVIQAAASAFSNILGTVVSPIGGGASAGSVPNAVVVPVEPTSPETGNTSQSPADPDAVP